MRAPLTWLAEYVDLAPGATGPDVAASLVAVGLEEEDLHGGDITGPLVVGRVLSCVDEPQKNGRTIRWCTVDVGPHGQMATEGKHQEIVQDEEQASYEGWCKDKEAQINWHAHIDHIYNLIRGCDPAPGAWTTIGGIKVRIYETRKHPVRRFEDVRGKPGEISAIGDKGVSIIVQGGQVELLKVRPEGGAKVSAAEFFTSIGFNVGNALTDPLPLPEAAE